MDDKTKLAVERVKCKYGLEMELKQEQELIIHYVSDGNDVFGLLPTGFGKSSTCTMVPLILDELDNSKVHTSLVISPLKSLMKDQVEFLKSHNIKSIALMDDTTIKDVMEEDYSLIFSSPEAVVLPKWRKVIKDHVSKKTSLLVFDECHCMSLWGLDFRPSYRKVTTLQSLVEVPNLALTATATTKIQDDVYDLLGFQRDLVKVVAALPNRSNIFLHVENCTEKFDKELAWILEHLKTNDHSKKIIVYVRSINLCSQIYMWLITNLMEKAFVGSSPSTKNRRKEMFHANTDSETKNRILEDFISTNSNIKVLISTVAFGMGVDIKDVDVVVHWGFPTSSLAYWQEVGRCGRDGRKSYAVCYAYKRSYSKLQDDEFKKIVGWTAV